MKKTEIISKLNEVLAKDFKEHGFKPHKNNNEIGWIKVSGEDLAFIDLQYIPYLSAVTGKRERFMIEPQITISIHEIENRYKKITSNEHLTKQVDFRSLFVKLIYLEMHPNGFYTGSHFQYDWFIENEYSISGIAGLLVSKMKSIGFPFCENIKSVEQVDLILNDMSTLDKRIIYSPSFPDRAIKGIIAAKIVDNPNLNFLLDYYSKLVSNWSDMAKREFDNLLVYLDNWK